MQRTIIGSGGVVCRSEEEGEEDARGKGRARGRVFK